MLTSIRRTRLLAAAGVAAALTAALPAAAAVRDEHKFKLTLTQKKTKVSTGVTFTSDRTNYTAPPAGTAPLTVKKTVFSLPVGTKINTAAATRCSIAILETQGAAGCKAGTAIGSGEAVAITGLAALDPLTEQIQLFATRTGMAAFLSGLKTVVIPLTVKANKITAVVPRLCLGTGANPCASGEAVPKTLKITIKPKTKGTGATAKRLVTTPASCVGGKWTSRATYTFANGDTDTQKSTATCRR